ncbi:unnamed protein product [Danaus chrysippus]|uniref:(African queen) hypothetical protein n=1 Tax=Danaus chrysippus TaxID=151541 RepID=A0A8J2PZH8_9NEOP|nr:unnamed protein product [Danaus chrysippus]
MWSNGFDSAIEHRRLCKHGYVPVVRVRLEGTEHTCGRGGRETRSAALSHHPRADGRVRPPSPGPSSHTSAPSTTVNSTTDTALCSPLSRRAEKLPLPEK